MSETFLLNEGFMTLKEFNTYQELRCNHPSVKIVHKSKEGITEQELQMFALEMYPIKESSSILASDFKGDLSKCVVVESPYRYTRLWNLSPENFRITFESMFGEFKLLPASYVALCESKVNFGMVDDGPAVFFKDLQSYKNRSDRFAALIGWKVQSFTINKELEKFNTDYPNGSGNYPVSWGPSGDVGEGASTEDVSALDKWKSNTQNTLDGLAKIGWKFSEILDNTYDG